MDLITTTDGRLLNAATIVEFRPIEGGYAAYDAQDELLGTVDADKTDGGELIPNTTGAYAVLVEHDGEMLHVPIVAWRVPRIEGLAPQPVLACEVDGSDRVVVNIHNDRKRYWSFNPIYQGNPWVAQDLAAELELNPEAEAAQSNASVAEQR